MNKHNQLGKVFSWAMPIGIFVFSVVLGRRSYLASTLIETTFYAIIALIFLFIGLVCLIQRKEIWNS